MLFSKVSGCLVNWDKTFAIVSPSNERFPALFDMVKVLQPAEHNKYLGFPASPGKEDPEVGKYVTHKVLKCCAALQSQYLTVAARVVVLNFLLEQILWYYFAVWMPSKKELDNLKNIFRRFLWAKNVEGPGHSSKVAWEKVIQEKRLGGRTD